MAKQELQNPVKTTVIKKKNQQYTVKKQSKIVFCIWETEILFQHDWIQGGKKQTLLWILDYIWLDIEYIIIVCIYLDYR